MRRQDELISLYTGQNSLARKFLISQMEGLSRAFDSEELLDFLQGTLTDPNPVVRGQALYTVSQFLPGFIQRRYAVSTQTPGTWTAYGALHGMGAAGTRKAVERARKAPAVRQAALMVIRPIIDALLASAGTWEGWNRIRALLALGHFGLKASFSALAPLLDSSPADIAPGLALAEIDQDEARAALVNAIKTHGPSVPDLYLLLGLLKADDAAGLVRDSMGRTNNIGRANIARSLVVLPPDEAKASFRELARRGEGWVDGFGLAALEQIGSPELLSTVCKYYQSGRHWFLRLQALKAAGGIRCPASIAFCLDALRGAPPKTCAVALESLVRLGTPPEQLREAAVPYLTSPDVKARTNAILAALSADEAPDAPAVQDMLWSTDPLWRLEAAYCLGYLQSDRTLELLVTLANADPAYIVRHQAVKSLSKYPSRDALRHLVPIVTGPEPRLALTAARVMARYEGDEARLVGEAIGHILDRPMNPAIRAVLYRTLGSVVARSPIMDGPSILARGLEESDARVLIGVIDGWALAGAGENASPPPRLASLTRSEAPRARARALLAMWHGGSLEAAEQLAGLLSSDDPELVGPALGCALEMGLLLSDVALGGRFPELSRKLLVTSESPEFEEFASHEGQPSSLIRERPEAPEVEFQVRRPTRREATVQPADVTMPELPSQPPPAAPAPEGPVFTLTIPMKAPSLPLAKPVPPTAEAASPTFASTLVDSEPEEPPRPAQAPRPPPAASDDVPTRQLAPAGPPVPAPEPEIHEDLEDLNESQEPVAPEAPTLPLTGTTQKIKVARKRTTAHDLRAFLSRQQPVEDQLLRGRLEKATYLVDALSPASQLRELMLHPAVLTSLVIAALAVAITFLWSSRSSSSSSSRPNPGEYYLRVDSCDGPCRTASMPLGPGSIVGPQSPLSTGLGGEMVLLTPRNGKLAMRASSACVFEGKRQDDAKRPRFGFSDPSGTIQFDFRHEAMGVAVTVGPALLVCTGSMSIAGQEGSRTVTLEQGDGWVVAGGQRSKLVPRQTIRVE